MRVNTSRQRLPLPNTFQTLHLGDVTTSKAQYSIDIDYALQTARANSPKKAAGISPIRAFYQTGENPLGERVFRIRVTKNGSKVVFSSPFSNDEQDLFIALMDATSILPAPFNAVKAWSKITKKIAPQADSFEEMWSELGSLPSAKIICEHNFYSNSPSGNWSGSCYKCGRSFFTYGHDYEWPSEFYASLEELTRNDFEENRWLSHDLDWGNDPDIGTSEITLHKISNNDSWLCDLWTYSDADAGDYAFALRYRQRAANARTQGLIKHSSARHRMQSKDVLSVPCCTTVIDGNTWKISLRFIRGKPPYLSWEVVKDNGLQTIVMHRSPWRLYALEHVGIIAKDLVNIQNIYGIKVDEVFSNREFLRPCGIDLSILQACAYLLLEDFNSLSNMATLVVDNISVRRRSTYRCMCWQVDDRFLVYTISGRQQSIFGPYKSAFSAIERHQDLARFSFATKNVVMYLRMNDQWNDEDEASEEVDDDADVSEENIDGETEEYDEATHELSDEQSANDNNDIEDYIGAFITVSNHRSHLKFIIRPLKQAMLESIPVPQPTTSCHSGRH